jgi:hypothetical protein
MVVNPEDVEWLVRVATEAQVSGMPHGPNLRRVPWEAAWKAGLLVALAWSAWELRHIAESIETQTSIQQIQRR